MSNNERNLNEDHILEFQANIQGVPKNMGIQWRIGYRLCYELAMYNT